MDSYSVQSNPEKSNSCSKDEWTKSYVGDSLVAATQPKIGPLEATEMWEYEDYSVANRWPENAQSQARDDNYIQKAEEEKKKKQKERFMQIVGMLRVKREKSRGIVQNEQLNAWRMPSQSLPSRPLVDHRTAVIRVKHSCMHVNRSQLREKCEPSSSFHIDFFNYTRVVTIALVFRSAVDLIESR